MVGWPSFLSNCVILCSISFSPAVNLPRPQCPSSHLVHNSLILPLLPPCVGKPHPLFSLLIQMEQVSQAPKKLVIITPLLTLRGIHRFSCKVDVEAPMTLSKLYKWSQCSLGWQKDLYIFSCQWNCALGYILNSEISAEIWVFTSMWKNEMHFSFLNRSILSWINPTNINNGFFSLLTSRTESKKHHSA